MKRYTTVEAYLEGHPEWHEELTVMREIILASGLVETVKWGGPVYTHQGKNVVGMAAFKEHYAIWFFQGVFLSDPHGKLVNAQEGSTKGLRQWRLQKGDRVDRTMVLEYIAEAIVNQEQGKSIQPVKAKTVAMPEALATALQQDAALQESYAALTPGRQREYAEYVGEAKREATRLSRLEKITPMIRAGIGLNDKYRKG
ncbi:MAG: YdeI/OmpD-associated family protein [Bacteroidota bacterium]